MPVRHAVLCRRCVVSLNAQRGLLPPQALNSKHDDAMRALESRLEDAKAQLRASADRCDGLVEQLTRTKEQLMGTVQQAQSDKIAASSLLQVLMCSALEARCLKAGSDVTPVRGLTRSYVCVVY